MNLKLNLVSCGVLAGLLFGGAVEAADKPNIILFLVDDMGWQDTSVQFGETETVWNKIYYTPNMQRLADQGMKFTNAYAAHPVCSPTRTSLMTGKNPARSHVDDWVGHGQSNNTYLKSPTWASRGINPGDGNVTLPSVLKDAGYRTAHLGKAHFGKDGGADPTNLGFDINIGGTQSGGPYGGWYSPGSYPNMGDRPAGEYLTDSLTYKAEDIIADAASDDVPFFMNMAAYAVHTPIVGAPGNYQPDLNGLPSVEKKYSSMLTAMDASLGRIMDRLEDPNGDGDTSDSISDNTIIMFMSDNGGLSNHTRSRNGLKTITDLDGNFVAQVNYTKDGHNGPIKSGKGSAYEGGTRVPMIVGWAGQGSGQAPINSGLSIVAGSSSDVPVHADDFFPTILSMAGITNPVDGNDQDGQDLSGLLSGEAFERDGGLYWHYPHQWYSDIGVGAGIEPFSSVREGDMKLIYFYGDGVVDGVGYDPRVEMYDLSVDIGEDNNLVGADPELAVALRDQLMAYLASVDAGMPIVRATNNVVDIPMLGSTILGGDLNSDFVIDADDWLLFKAGFGDDVSGLSDYLAYVGGDVSGDGVIDEIDFREFKRLYDLMNGGGTFAAMQTSIPEPTVLGLLGMCGIAMVGRRR